MGTTKEDQSRPDKLLRKGIWNCTVGGNRTQSSLAGSGGSLGFANRASDIFTLTLPHLSTAGLSDKYPIASTASMQKKQTLTRLKDSLGSLVSAGQGTQERTTAPHRHLTRWLS